MKHFTKTVAWLELSKETDSAAHGQSEPGAGAVEDVERGGSRGERQTVHTAKKLDRLSAECATGFWRPALLRDQEERHAGAEECVSRAQGAETRFPVCISSVFNVELRATACFLCVMGARRRIPTKRQHATMSVTGPASRYTHQQHFTGFYIQTHSLKVSNMSLVGSRALCLCHYLCCVDLWLEVTARWAAFSGSPCIQVCDTRPQKVHF